VADDGQRLFVAVPLPPDAVADCAALIDVVRGGPVGGIPRWVHVPNLHLTVRFLGATAPAVVDAVADAVEGAASGQTAFDVVLAGAGSFPGTGKVRTLWLGIERGADELGTLARRVDEAVAPLGWAHDDRPYRPHLTVARLDAASRADGVAAAGALTAAAAGWRTAFPADELVLFRSHLGAARPRYEPIRRVPLRG
jgi:RNA 2',3'-cyclic 3'-phosphodiesterase